MTANALPEDREACFAAGMNDYVAKPIRADELAAALKRTQPLRNGDAGVVESEISLEAARVPYPATIACAAGMAVFAAGGQALTRYNTAFLVRRSGGRG